MMIEKNHRLFFYTCVILTLALVPVAQTISPNFLHLPTASATSGIGTIVINNVKNTSATVTASPFQVTLSNFNASGGNSRLLVVAVDADNSSVNSVTFNGGSVTRSLTQASGSFHSEYTAFWYLKNPVGIGTVTVTMAGASQVIVGAYALSGVDQANPIPTTATNYTQTASPPAPNPNISLTTEYPNSLVLDSAVLYGGSQLSSSTCTQEWSTQMPNKVTGASSYTTRASAGPVTCTWHNSVIQNGWDDTAVEIKAIGAAPQVSPITLNGKSTASGFVPASSSTVTLYNFSPGTGTNRLLVVGVEQNWQSVSSITFGGVALTKKIAHFTNNDAEFWYLKNPSSAPANIQVTMSGGTRTSAFVIGAYAFFGVDQANPIPNSSFKFAVSSSPNISITTTQANEWVLDSPSIFGGVTLSSPNCNQQWNSNVQFNSTQKITGASSSQLVPTTGTVNCKWTASASEAWDDIAIGIKGVPLTASTGILMPLYCAPYSNDSSNCADGFTYSWQPVYSAHKDHPRLH